MNKQKKYYRVIAVMLALLMSGGSMISCSNDTPSETDGKKQNVVQETETDETELTDGLPKDLNFDGRTFNVFIDRNFDVMKGPDEMTGNVVDDAVYERNRTVEERLKIDLEYTLHEVYEQGTIVKDIVNTYVMSGDSSIDMFTGYQVDMIKMHNDGSFINCYDLDYIDWSKPWWKDAYMTEIQVNKDVRTFLVGDYFLSALMATSVLYCNNTLYGNMFGDPNGLYKMVLDGKWTMDKLAEISEATFIDVNQNGMTDGEDQLGYAAYLAYASVDPFAYISDVELSTRDSDGNLTLNLLDERLVDLNAKVVNFFYQPGSFINFGGENELDNAFIEGRAMFLGFRTLGNAENFRDMEDDYGFLPYPKFEESQKEYHSVVRAAACPGAIVTTSKNIDIAGAILEALNFESYKQVIPAYYEKTLKGKYSRDNLSSQIIELIYDSAYTDFVFAYDSILLSIGTVMRNMVQANSIDYVSTVTEKHNAVLEAFDAIVASYEK